MPILKRKKKKKTDSRNRKTKRTVKVDKPAKQKAKKSIKRGENGQKTPKIKIRKDYEFNHGLIRDAFIELLKDKKGRKPTVDELVKRTGLGVNTIRRHFENLKFEPMKSTVRALSDDVILSIYRAAMKGGSHSQKLWFQIVEGWKESKAVEVNAKGLILDGTVAPDAARNAYLEMLKNA